MASTGETLTSQEYIAHHLHHLQVGSGFWTVNIDSMVFFRGLGDAVYLVIPQSSCQSDQWCTG